jgi:hypothetical protein
MSRYVENMEASCKKSLQLAHRDVAEYTRDRNAPVSYSSDRLSCFVNDACMRAFVRLTHCILASTAAVLSSHDSSCASSFLFEPRMIVHG